MQHGKTPIVSVYETLPTTTGQWLHHISSGRSEECTVAMTPGFMGTTAMSGLGLGPGLGYSQPNGYGLGLDWNHRGPTELPTELLMTRQEK